MEGEILTVKELAKYLKMNEHTVYRLARKGELPAVKIGGGWRFKKDVINKWIETNSSNKEKHREQ